VEFFFSQLIGFLVGIFSSWAFWYVLLLAKPKISVSRNVVFNEKKGSLLVKVMNRGRRQATDVQVSLALVERDSIGRFFTLHSAQLRKDSLPALAPKHESHKPWGLRTAYIFATDEGVQILEKWSSANQNERRLVFTLSATDGLSGTKFVQQTSYRLEDVKSGRFGVWLEIQEDGLRLLPQGKQDSDDDGDFIA
jgi:hypothetical protein